MTILHEMKLLNGKRDLVGSAFNETITSSLAATPGEREVSENVLQRDYPAVYRLVGATREYLEEVGLSQDEAALVAIGVNIALTTLKNIGERQAMPPNETHPQ